MAMLTSAELRRVNLIQTLLEEAQEAGNVIEEPPDAAIAGWSEDQIRGFFAHSSTCLDQTTHAAVDSTSLQAASRCTRQTRCPAPSQHEFEKWFPGTKRWVNSVKPLTYKYRVLCFHNAGSAEDMFTSEGTGQRKALSPLLEWCRRKGAECLAVQLPGRAMRTAEPFLTSAQQLATELLPVVASRLQDTPYIVVAHSLGAWLAYEFLCHARHEGLPMPSQVFLSAMPYPSIPQCHRPWRPQHKLQEKEFQAECCCWDINPVVFSPALWPVYQNILRADFGLFDQYSFQHEGAEPFSFPLHTFYGVKDSRVTAEMVQGWRTFTNGPFSCSAVHGNHLWPLDKAAKTQWLQCIVDKLQDTLWQMDKYPSALEKNRKETV